MGKSVGVDAAPDYPWSAGSALLPADELAAVAEAAAKQAVCHSKPLPPQLSMHARQLAHQEGLNDKIIRTGGKAAQTQGFLPL